MSRYAKQLNGLSSRYVSPHRSHNMKAIDGLRPMRQNNLPYSAPSSVLLCRRSVLRLIVTRGRVRVNSDISTALVAESQLTPVDTSSIHPVWEYPWYQSVSTIRPHPISTAAHLAAARYPCCRIPLPKALSVYTVLRMYCHFASRVKVVVGLFAPMLRLERHG